MTIPCRWLILLAGLALGAEPQKAHEPIQGALQAPAALGTVKGPNAPAPWEKPTHLPSVKLSCPLTVAGLCSSAAEYCKGTPGWNKNDFAGCLDASGKRYQLFHGDPRFKPWIDQKVKW